MAKYTLQDGTEIEAFTQEEVTAKVNEAVTAKEAEHKTALEAKQVELDKAIEKATNLETAKNGAEGAKKTAEQQIEALTKQVSDLTNTVKGNVKEELLTKLSGGDAEIRKKIELEYNQFNGDPADKAEIESRLLKAVKLAIPTEQPNTLSEAMSFAGSRGAATKTETASVIGDTTKEQGKKFGLSEEDYKKYGEAAEKIV